MIYTYMYHQWQCNHGNQCLQSYVLKLQFGSTALAMVTDSLPCLSSPLPLSRLQLHVYDVNHMLNPHVKLRIGSLDQTRDCMQLVLHVFYGKRLEHFCVKCALQELIIIIIKYAVWCPLGDQITPITAVSRSVSVSRSIIITNCV